MEAVKAFTFISTGAKFKYPLLSLSPIDVSVKSFIALYFRAHYLLPR